MILPSALLSTSGAQCPVLGTSVQNEQRTAGRAQWRATKILRGLENLPYKERLGPFSPENRKLSGDLFCAYHYLMDWRQVDEARLVSIQCNRDFTQAVDLPSTYFSCHIGAPTMVASNVDMQNGGILFTA